MLPDSDERQVAPTIDGIRKDHSARYMWALDYVRNKTVIDYGCGVGYGSAIMATAAAEVLGIDADGPAVSYARAHYATTGARFECETVDSLPRLVGSAVAVAFEVIEHIEAPDKFLADVNADLLLASVPNEHVFPWVPGLKFHHRHYTPEQFEQLLNDCGWQVLEWWGQEGPESMPVANTQGRTQLVVAERSATPKGGTWKELPPPPDVVYVATGGRSQWEHPTGKTPKTIMIAALGNSKSELINAMIQPRFKAPWDELWVINKGIGPFGYADVAFILDDVYDYATHDPEYGQQMRAFKGPIIGQTSLPNDGSIPFHFYPYRQVLNYWKQDAENYLHTISIPLVIAYAGMIGVTKIMTAGVDCVWPGRPELTESSGGVVQHWIGRFLQSCGPWEGAGNSFEIASSSTLNDTHRFGEYGHRRIYGLLRQPIIARDEFGDYHLDFGNGWDVG